MWEHSEEDLEFYSLVTYLSLVRTFCFIYIPEAMLLEFIVV